MRITWAYNSVSLLKLTAKNESMHVRACHSDYELTLLEFQTKKGEIHKQKNNLIISLDVQTAFI